MARWDRNDDQTVPDWFWTAVEAKTSQAMVEVAECDVYFRSWAYTGRQFDKTPILLFVHGMYAHSHWWDFIAPFFANDYQVVAMDLTGMGDSDFRYDYSGATFAQEIIAVRDHVAHDGQQVILVAHSFGARMAVKAAASNVKSIDAVVLVDSGLHDPNEELPEYPDLGGGRAKTYPSREAAESRFRLFPPQTCDNDYVLKYIAKHSVMAVEGGYAWKYDPDLPIAMVDVDPIEGDYRALEQPVAVIYGEKSLSFTQQTRDFTLSRLPHCVAVNEIKDAQHHVFLDQPLAFIDVLQDVLPQLT